MTLRAFNFSGFPGPTRQRSFSSGCLAFGAAFGLRVAIFLEADNYSNRVTDCTSVRHLDSFVRIKALSLRLLLFIGHERRLLTVFFTTAILMFVASEFWLSVS